MIVVFSMSSQRLPACRLPAGRQAAGRKSGIPRLSALTRQRKPKAFAAVGAVDCR